MKAITLSQEQSNKLLEMCVNLFPEYKYIATGEVFEEKNKYITTNEPEKSLFHLTLVENDGSFVNIHWFEFCMTHLVNKTIFSDNNPYPSALHNYNGFAESILEFVDDNINFIHPIDYLYEEFKKL